MLHIDVFLSTTDASSNPAADWLNNMNDMYVVAGKDYPMKKIIVAKIL